MSKANPRQCFRTGESSAREWWFNTKPASYPAIQRSRVVDRTKKPAIMEWIEQNRRFLALSKKNLVHLKRVKVGQHRK
jgi:hypothetical protein